MALVLGPENFHGRFHLGQGCDKVGFSGLPVGVKAPGAQGLPLANAGVHNDPVQLAEFLVKGLEHLPHLVMVIHIQRHQADANTGVLLLQLGFKGFQPLGAPGTQGQVVAPGGKFPGHAFTEAGTGSGDQNGSAHRRVLVRARHAIRSTASVRVRFFVLVAVRHSFQRPSA